MDICCHPHPWWEQLITTKINVILISGRDHFHTHGHGHGHGHDSCNCHRRAEDAVADVVAAAGVAVAAGPPAYAIDPYSSLAVDYFRFRKHCAVVAAAAVDLDRHPPWRPRAQPPERMRGCPPPRQPGRCAPNPRSFEAAAVVVGKGAAAVEAAACHWVRSHPLHLPAVDGACQGSLDCWDEEIGPNGASPKEIANFEAVGDQAGFLIDSNFARPAECGHGIAVLGGEHAVVAGDVAAGVVDAVDAENAVGAAGVVAVAAAVEAAAHAALPAAFPAASNAACRSPPAASAVDAVGTFPPGVVGELGAQCAAAVGYVAAVVVAAGVGVVASADLVVAVVAAAAGGGADAAGIVLLAHCCCRCCC